MKAKGATAEKAVLSIGIPFHHPSPAAGLDAGRRSSLFVDVGCRLRQLCMEGRMGLARRLFDALPRPIPTLIWNALLIGYICNSLPDDALRLYRLMNCASEECSDHYTYSSVLKACADSRRLRLGQSIHCRILRRLSPHYNLVLCNSLLSMYASALHPLRISAVDLVSFLFDRMPVRNVVSWNTLIGWCLRSRRPALALDRFLRMLDAGILPSPVSFVNVFNAAASVSFIGRTHFIPDSLYGMLIKIGAQAVNVFVVSSAIFMFSERCDILSARRVFDFAVQKNIQVWNTMIGGYVQNAFYEEAIALFREVLETIEVVADDVTFLSSLMAISYLQDCGLGQQVHAYLVKVYSNSLPLILNNALMVMYSRCDDVKSAFAAFYLMSERDIVSWNTMISAFVQKGMNSKALLLAYEMMRKVGLTADFVTVTALLSAASNLCDLNVGKETHGYLIRQGIQFEGMLSYLIDTYAKSGCLDTAERIFYYGDECDDRDLVAWNAMISGYIHSKHLDSALSLFNKMLETNCSPNHVTISLILSACDPMDGIQAGRKIHGFAIRRHLHANVFVGTALIDMYSKCSGIISACKVFNFMVEKNRVTYTTMLSGFGQHGLGERALSLFKTMLSFGIMPDEVTFVVLISACSYSGLIDEGLAAFESMDEFGVVATPEHYCCVVDLLGRAGRVEEAFKFIRNLGDSGSHIGIWGSLLAACRIHGKYELGKLVSRRLFEMENQSGIGNAGYHVLMSNVHAAEGRWDGVHRVRQEMKGRGLIKEPGSCWIETCDASRRFKPRVSSHHKSNHVHAMLDGLALDMKLLDERQDSLGF